MMQCATITPFTLLSILGIIIITMLNNVWCMAFTSSRSAILSQGDMNNHQYKYQTPKARTNCDTNCSLVVDEKTGNFFQTNAIAVSFVVNVKERSKDNKTEGYKFTFVWVHNDRAKFLLGLPDDSEILSLTTLQHSVDVCLDLIMHRLANQSRCFYALSKECQAEVIVVTFYNNAEFNLSPGKPFCFPPLDNSENTSQSSDIVHKCCSMESTGVVNCTELIEPNTWVAYAIVSVQFGSAIMFILSPLLFKYLPTRDTQVAKRSRGTALRTKSNTSLSNIMSVDLSSPNLKLLTLTEPLTFVAFGGDEAQPCYSRFCRAFALFVFPIVFCVYVILFFVNNHSAKIRSNVTYYTGLVSFLKPPSEYYLFSIVVFCIFILGVLVVIPGRLSGLGKALSGRKDEKTFLGFEKPEHLINVRAGKIGFQFLQANMVFHLKYLVDLQFWVFILKVIFSPCQSQLASCFCRKSPESELLSDSEERLDPPPLFCVILGVLLLPVIMPLWTAFVLIALLVYITPVGYVTFRIAMILFKKDVPCRSGCCERLHPCFRVILVAVLYCLFILFCISVLASYVFVTLMFGIFFYILGKIFLFVLIGLVFNVHFYLPYTVLGSFVLFYIGAACNHYFSVYENLRIVLFKECEKYEEQMSKNGLGVDSTSQPSGTGLLLFLDYNNNPSIPVNLFVTTYRRLRPRGKTFFTILGKLLLTFIYMSVAFASVMALDEAEDTSSYTQAAFLCAAFVLPLIVHHAGRTHSKQRKKELGYQVRLIIHRYVSKTAAPTNNTHDNSPGATIEIDTP